MYIKISKCPHCRKTLDVGINEPLDDPLGKPGYFICPFCNTPISNGKTEWEDKSPFQKGNYVFRCVITVLWVSALTLFFSAILIGAFPKIGEFFGMHDRLDSPAFIVYALCIVCGISYWVIHTTKIEITESRKRTSTSKRGYP
jgi:hypothetical protein